MSVLATIQEELQHVDELIAQLERNAALNPSKKSIFANIRALEKERRVLQVDFERAAANANVDVVRYKVVNKTLVTVDGLTDVWREFQNALTLVYYALKGEPLVRPTVKRGRKPKTPPPELPPLQLGFGYTFPGSVGVAFTLPRESMTEGNLFPNPDAIINAATTMFDVAKSYDDSETIHKYARQLGPVPVEAMYKWVGSHLQHHYGVGIDVQSGGEIKNQVTIQYEEFGVLSEKLSATTVDEKLEVIGSLVAVDTLQHTFQINADSGEEFVGTYESAITAEHAAKVPWRYKANILRIQKVIPDDAQADKYSLLTLEGLD